MTEPATKLRDAAKKNDSDAIVAILSGLLNDSVDAVIAAVGEVAAADPASSRYVASHMELGPDGRGTYKVTVRKPGPTA